MSATAITDIIGGALRSTSKAFEAATDLFPKGGVARSAVSVMKDTMQQQEKKLAGFYRGSSWNTEAWQIAKMHKGQRRMGGQSSSDLVAQIRRGAPSSYNRSISFDHQAFGQINNNLNKIKMMQASGTMPKEQYQMAPKGSMEARQLPRSSASIMARAQGYADEANEVMHGMNHSGGVASSNRSKITDFGSPHLRGDRAAKLVIGEMMGKVLNLEARGGKLSSAQAAYQFSNIPTRGNFVHDEFKGPFHAPIKDFMYSESGALGSSPMGRMAANGPFKTGERMERPVPRKFSTAGMQLPSALGGSPISLGKKMQIELGGVSSSLENRSLMSRGSKIDLSNNKSPKGGLSEAERAAATADPKYQAWLAKQENPSALFGTKGKPSVVPSAPSATVGATPGSPTVASNQSITEGIGMMGMVGIGAGLGAGASYMSGGSAIQGAFAGAMVGAGAGGANYTGSHYLGSGKMPNMGGYSKQITEMAGHLTTNEGRAAMILGGGLLGGFAFGGNKSRARGFNQNKGNRIGR